MVDVEHRPLGLGLCFGLTGGIACGKSTVAGFFADLGAYILDADRLGHEAIEPGKPAYREILARFGEEILDSNGGIDRTRLGPIIFADPHQRLALNAIVHPRVIAQIQKLTLEEHARNPRTVVILDAPLIYETSLAAVLNKIVVVWCRPEQQLERLMAKTGIPRGQAEQRIRSQMTLEEKKRRADYQIDCSGSLAESRAQAAALYLELRRIMEAT